jgi:rare lipoprotein A
MHSRLRPILIVFAVAVALPAWPATRAHRHDRTAHPPRTQVGKASIYAKKFAGRKMADGARMDPNDSNAASKTLPLGTRARVTNLANGKSAVVTIEDRGPHVPGRIVDLSPATAGRIGLTRQQGVAPVAVTPVEQPGQPEVAQE